MLPILAPELMPLIADAKHHVHLLDTLPLVLTHHDHGRVNLMGDPTTGGLTALIDWDWASIEAFGMKIHSFYDDFTAHRIDDEILSYDMPSPNANGKSVWDTLEEAFWEQLWETLEGVLSRETHGVAVRTTALIGAMNRFFDLETLDEIDDRGGMDKNEWQHRSMMLRTNAYLPKLPCIEDTR
ncbi:hypothetical protein ANO11243_092660 [Dothideomycetidae sp. 11243]|nr:hypothetical protein ANO11243_092660 [fungal sp. No.11243]